MKLDAPAPTVQRPADLPCWKKGLLFLVLLVVMVLLMEGLGQVYYRFLSRDHRWQLGLYLGTKSTQCFSNHPYLVVAPIPGRHIEQNGIQISHNHLGFRGPETTLHKPPGRIRIVTLGGSSTYCVKISDQDTWPVLLQQQLGPGVDVVNLGVPGYSTAEHVIQTALCLSDLQPDIVICYAGWNDVQNMHIKDLRPDYSDFHSQKIADTLEVTPVDRIHTPFALARLAHGVAFNLFQRRPHSPVPDQQAFTPAMDARALGLFQRNLRSLAALCQSQGFKLLLVPQLVNSAVLTNSAPYGWVPFVNDKDLPAAMAAYNQAMREVAQATTTPFAGRILTGAFDPADFVDEGHFSRRGCEKFAAILRDELQPLLPKPQQAKGVEQ